MQPSSMTGDAQASSERFLLLLFSLMRLAILIQVTVASVVAWEHFRHPAVLVVLLAGVWTESVLLTALMSGVYIGVMTARFGFGSTLLVNSVTYWAYALVAWGVCGWYRRLSQQLDQARQEAVERGMELASSRHAQELQELRMRAVEAALEHERERAGNFRDLHDRVLQTLEFLGRDGWSPDEGVRDRIVGEAVWLRQLIEGGLDGGRGDLATALAEVVERQAAAGLRVDLNAARIAADGPAVSSEVVAALAGAAEEALGNVRKHAGTNHAVVRAVPERDGVLVSVLDQGRGFDPATVRHGVGIPQSLNARLRQVGGTVRIDSTPGTGTYVELWAPAPTSAQEVCPQNPGHAPAR